MSPLPRFQFVKNLSSNSYDLQITNVTESDLGLYFCATEKLDVREVNKSLSSTYVYNYGKTTTRVKLSDATIIEPRTVRSAGFCCTLCVQQQLFSPVSSLYACYAVKSRSSCYTMSSVGFLMSVQMNALLILIGLMSSEHSAVYGSVLDVSVRSGENIVMFCDCTLSPGVLVMWYRNCSHKHQPMLVLKLRTKYLHNLRNDPVSWMTPLPRFQFIKNVSSNSYDLLITNITKSDEGLYFCGTETHKLDDDKGNLQKTYSYEFGSASTQITLKSSEISNDFCNAQSHHPFVSLLTLMPAAVILFSNVCFILIYHHCQKHDAKLHARAHQNCFSTTVMFGTTERKLQ
ncbi:hypothetical protein WMY93_006436 [Mugilogobius chulae]|uniref:Ig-like domain-containing protein n=1 Tax=Mugilogobius chulae TaxID=88201 RepID=A0AAW0PWD7_9GOBI